MRTVVLIAISVWASVAVATAADVGGNWKLDGSIGQFPVDIVCSFKQTEGKLTGVCKGADIGELSLKGETEGDTARWSYDVNFQGQPFTITYTAKLESATGMKGTISVSGNESGSFVGKKQ